MGSRLSWCLIVVPIALLVRQAMSLSYTPLPNSYLWWGDETWLMLEFRTQMLEGVFRHPFAFGSSIFQGNPMILSSMWLTALLYGGVSLISRYADLVLIGRVISFSLACLLLIGVLRYAWKRGAHPSLIALGLTLIVASRSFFLTSHSARYDILTSVFIAGFCVYLYHRIEFPSKSYFLTGVLWMAGLTISVHATLLTLLPMAYFVARSKDRMAAMLGIVGGGLVVIGALGAAHMINSPAAIAGQSTFAQNLETLPILRPFSRSVQIANLLQKWELLVQYALAFIPVVLVLLVSCFVVRTRERHLAVIAVLTLLGWLLFQSAGPSSYLIHFLPLLGLAFVVISMPIVTSIIPQVSSVILTLVLCFYGWQDLTTAEANGQLLHSNNQRALRTWLPELDSSFRVLALNPAQDYLLSNRIPFATPHLFELPDGQGVNTLQQAGVDWVLTYNSGILPNAMREFASMRELVTGGEMSTGQLLDIGRSYFFPLDPRPDTIFLSPLNTSSRSHR